VLGDELAWEQRVELAEAGQIHNITRSPAITEMRREGGSCPDMINFVSWRPRDSI
jgi:rhamnose utilization protein RhaD (predicted bifunctional aldolase and dehydrogenase)